MSQYAEVILNCDELSNIIIRFLIKDNKLGRQDDYSIEYKLTNYNFVEFTIIKKINIGEF